MQELVYLNDDERATLPLLRSLTAEQQDMIRYLIRTLAADRPALPADDPTVIPFRRTARAG